MEELIEQEGKYIAYDCFALAGVDGKHRHCGILKTGEYRIGQGCGGCSFYKTREQFAADAVAAARHVKRVFGEESDWSWRAEHIILRYS